MAPQYLSLASVCKMRVLVEGIFKGGSFCTSIFRLLTASVYRFVHCGGFFVSIFCSGLVSCESCGDKIANIIDYTEELLDLSFRREKLKAL